MKYEYGIKDGRVVLDINDFMTRGVDGTGIMSEGGFFGTLSDAKLTLKRMEVADKVYDRLNVPKRKIVRREIGKWEEVK